MLKYLSVLALLAPAGAAAAADHLAFGPPPPWVHSAPIPAAAESTGAVQLLLQESQTRFGPDGDQVYSHTAVKVLKTEGLAGAGALSFAWNPETQSLTVHQVEIIRDGRTIDVLKTQKFTVLRREKNLEAAVLDGTLTATLQPEDLRVGDVMQFAISTVRRDPVMKGHSESFQYMARPGTIGHFLARAAWPAAKNVRWRVFEGLPKANEKTTAEGTELTFDGVGVDAPKPPLGAPSRYSLLAAVEYSDFRDWAEVSALTAPLYAKAATLEPNSPLKEQIEKIKAGSPDPKLRAAAALRLVQEQTRYVFLGMNFGGYVPAAADLTWRRRFGDCKGKTALLLALLHGLGIDAQPALVASANGDSVERHLPAMGVFDHVIVRANIHGRIYWLDGTRLGDRGLDAIDPPPFRWALPVQEADAKLEKIDQPAFATPTVEETVQIDVSSGLQAPAKARIEYLMRGEDGLGAKLSYTAMQKADSDRTLREYFSSQYRWVKPDQVGYDWDEAKGELRIWMTGSGFMEWSKNGSVRDFSLHESSLGWSANFTRQPGPDQDAPYTVDYPNFRRWTVKVLLPKAAPVQLLSAEDVDRTIAGVRYRRSTRREDDVVTMVASEQSLAPEFPALDALAAGTALRNLYRYDVALRVPSTAIPERQETAHAEATAPTDAPGYSNRAVTRLLAGRYDDAIADFDKAIELEPRGAKHYYNRGVARFQKSDKSGALADFDKAIALDPANAFPLLARAEVHLGRSEEAEAAQDYAAAEALTHDHRQTALRKADAYRRLGRHDEAADIYDALAKAEPDKAHDPAFLVSRCDAVARSRHDPTAGLAYCDEARRSDKDVRTVLTARGLARLRLGQIQGALEDYDRVLALFPATPEALYGRGMARLRNGRPMDGKGDLQSATAADPRVAARFASWGLKP